MKKNYSKIGKNVIDLEIDALKKLKKLIGKSFNEAVDLISTNVNLKSFYVVLVKVA